MHHPSRKALGLGPGNGARSVTETAVGVQVHRDMTDDDDRKSM